MPLVTLRTNPCRWSTSAGNALIAMDEGPWGEVNRGKLISARWLAARLQPFGIVPGSKRKGEDTFKGYVLVQFADAFQRYLPPHSPEDPFVSVTRSQCKRDASFRGLYIGHKLRA